MSKPARPAIEASTPAPNPHVGPLRQKSTDRVYEALRRKVIDSELAPGSQILEQELAIMLGVSRTPLREALVRLENEGLLEIIPRHGVRIIPMSAADMREIYQVLVSLESTAAAALASQPPSDAALDELEAIFDRMDTFLKKEDITAWAREDERFHLKIVELAGNRRLHEIVSNCGDQAHRARMFTLRLQTHPQPAQSMKEHRQIIAALRKRDAAKAESLLRSHRERGLARQIDIIERYRFTQL
ncbi:MAG: GntR family transcriptional regulator [Bradyrhizobium sp.]|uniref:GntR family transcriptional regulator n=1 Tax=Bradyrhizobium sp. TaxID=376 RepID=UPI0029B683E8|nr:GntR family transcriptional regulator [Bradyrhizobium sp.]MDX3969194.1 GntR family transcriptional regulator [Bradyrhizobium sp.]